MERTVCSRFKLKKKIGAGSFGQIYSAESLITHQRVAVKLEKSNCRIPQLAFEAKLYKTLAGSCNVPRLHYYGQDGLHNVLAIDLLGKSLEDLLVKCGRKMSLKTVLMLADQMISCVEFIHSKNYIHRDIKPDNFVMGVGAHANQVFMIDYGLAKRYRDQNTHEHIPYCEGKQLTGTARYASLSAMKGNEQSRRDDLEALGYVWIYLLKGGLPWMGLSAQNRKNKYDQICRMKARLTFEQICRGCPREFVKYFKTVRELKFTDKPDYAALRELFRELFMSRGFVYDYKYEWSGARTQSQMSRPMTAMKRGVTVQKVDEEKQRRHSNFVTPRGGNGSNNRGTDMLGRRLSVAEATKSGMLTDSGKVSNANVTRNDRETGRVSATAMLKVLEGGRPSVLRKRDTGLADSGRVSAGMTRNHDRTETTKRDNEYPIKSGRLSSMKRDTEFATKSGRITVSSKRKDTTYETDRAKAWKAQNYTTKVTVPRWTNRLNVARM